MFINMLKTNLRIKFRQRGFQYILIAAIFLNLIFLPDRDAGYNTLLVDDYTGFYNSAFIGLTTAVLTVFFMSLFGFYLLSGLIIEDYNTEVGQVIATTSVNDKEYILGKFISNFVILMVIDLIIICTAVIVQLVRGEYLKIELGKIVLPHLIYVIPAFIFFSALTILFELLFRSRPSFGNISYFFIWMISIPISFDSSFDLLGYHGYEVYIRNNFSSLYENSIILGTGDLPATFVEYPGIIFNISMIIPPLVLFILTGIILNSSIKYFDRFSLSERKMELKINDYNRRLAEYKIKYQRIISIFKRNKKSTDEIQTNNEIGLAEPEYSISKVIKTSKTITLDNIKIEFKQLVGTISYKWKLFYLILLSISFIDSSILSSIGMIVWLIPIVKLSKIGIQERLNSIEELVFSTPNLLKKQFLSMFVSALLFVMMATSPFLLNLILFRPIGIIGWIISSIFLVSSALVLNMIANNEKLFTIIYLIVWYLGPANQLNWIDFTFIQDYMLTLRYSIFAFLSILLIIFGIFLRKRQIDNAYP